MIRLLHTLIGVSCAHLYERCLLVERDLQSAVIVSFVIRDTYLLGFWRLSH